MSFSFGFLSDDGDDKGLVSQSSDVSVDHRHPCKEIPLPGLNSQVPFRNVITNCASLKQSQLHYQSGIDKDLDVVSGQYEGGYKVWECSIDLVDYLFESCKVRSVLSELVTRGKVLELGCGHAFPAIAALQLGSNSVVLSDLNEEVILESTWPNVYLNCSTMLDKVKCYSGDWIALSEYLITSNGGQFEVILAAETLYTVESCKKMFYMIDKHLSADGIALIASKRFYFGVGGGTMELANLIESSSSGLSFEVVKEYMDGSSNIREIVQIRRKH